jgi:myo-inositol-1(or 4)-monophosphatase
VSVTAPRDLAIFEQAAVAAARSGGEILRHRFREPLHARAELKGLHDYVTETDRDAEAAVVGFLKKCFPEHGILAEEGSREEGTDRFRWIIDPLDGTTNFIHGVPTFAVSVALEGPDGLVAGAIYDPVHDEAFSAAAGLGARLNGRPIACRRVDSLDRCLIATGFPFRELSRLDRYLVAFETFVRSTSGIRRAGSASLDLAFTACGRYDGFWEIGLSAWDIAAGALLVREAGGIVTDVRGGDDFLKDGSITAGARGIHPAMLAITKEAFG